ncbi:MAG: VOC family protein [Anaerolineae bacterium]|nr:VOC family protein [Anaerolineae bacterium]
MLTTLTPVVESVMIAITVSDLKRSRDFYEGVLGFELKRFYEPTRWVAYQGKGGVYLAVLESDSLDPLSLNNEIVFNCEGIEALWLRLNDGTDVNIIEPLQQSLWGEKRFVVSDPDGYQLVFVQ